MISVVRLCVLGSRGSGPPGLGPRGPDPDIYGPKPYDFGDFGVTQGSKPYKFIELAWDRFVCPRRASEIKAVVFLLRIRLGRDGWG